jgi:hypothetical protein
LAEEDEALWCYANSSSEQRADFSGGIKTTIEDVFETEFFQIDSASRPDSAIPSEVVRRRNLHVHPERRAMNTANGPTESLGFVILYVRLDLQDLDGGVKLGRMKCHVVDSIDHILIGLKDIQRFQLYEVLRKIGERAVAADAEIDRDTGFNCYPVSMEEMLPTKETADAHPDEDVEAILRRHDVIFGDTLSPIATNAFEPMHLRLADPAAPMPRSLQAKTRPQPLAWSADIASQLQGLLDQGVIETTSSSFWSQVLMVKKQDGKLRLCVDYRALNKLLIHEGWQLPNISELLRKLAGKRYFGKVDMTAGYHQL